MKTRLLVALALALSAAPLALPAHAAKRKKHLKASQGGPRRSSRADKAPVKAAPTEKIPVSVKKNDGPAQSPDVELAAFGAALSESEGGLSAGLALPGSLAEKAGLKPGDRILFIDRAPARTRADAAAALRGWSAETRLAVLARRGLELVSLSSEQPGSEPAAKRVQGRLSAHESALRDARLARAKAEAAAEVKAAPPLEFKVHARQSFWLRFPKGIPAEAKPGDVIAGEITTAIATSGELDFLSVPAYSAVWAKVIEDRRSRETRQLRLLLFKLRPVGGSVYPVSGWITEPLGHDRPTKVSPGGTLVLSNPLATDDKRKLLVEPSTRFRAELLQPLVLNEPSRFFLAGPGLWIKTKEEPGGARSFEVSHVIAARSAERAGVRRGATVAAINGRSAAKLDFAGALAELYGAPGTTVKVSLKDEGGKTSTVELLRGVIYADGKASPLPPPSSR